MVVGCPSLAVLGPSSLDCSRSPSEHHLAQRSLRVTLADAQLWEGAQSSTWHEG